eukprot:XP_013972148.1 uncharacterized protein LOC106559298 [Canis lupus familiaris]
MKSGCTLQELGRRNQGICPRSFTDCRSCSIRRGHGEATCPRREPGTSLQAPDSPTRPKPKPQAVPISISRLGPRPRGRTLPDTSGSEPRPACIQAKKSRAAAASDRSRRLPGVTASARGPHPPPRALGQSQGPAAQAPRRKEGAKGRGPRRGPGPDAVSPRLGGERRLRARLPRGAPAAPTPRQPPAGTRGAAGAQLAGRQAPGPVGAQHPSPSAGVAGARRAGIVPRWAGLSALQPPGRPPHSRPGRRAPHARPDRDSRRLPAPPSAQSGARVAPRPRSQR